MVAKRIAAAALASPLAARRVGRTLRTMTDAAPHDALQGSRAALVVLVALVALSPWPFGSVHLRTTQTIALVSLVTALGAFAWDGWRGQLQLPSRAILWPLAGLWALAVLQLVPLPVALHRWIAPGSAFVWHPDVPAAAAVLGPGPHPISIFPDATRRWLAFATGVSSLALAAAPALRARRQLLRASTAVVSGGVAVALCGLVGRLAFGNELYGIWSVPTVAPFGPFVSKNHFAGYVELAALLAVGLASGLADEARRGDGWLSWIDSHRAKWVVLAWGAAMVLILAVPASLSRGGVVSLAAGLLAFVALRPRTRRHSRASLRGLAGALAAAVVLALGLATVLPTEARDRVLSLAGISTEHSGSYRLGVWRDTLRLIASSPLVGSGFGAYADALPRFKTAAGNLLVEHAESDWLELAAEGGLLGLVLVGAAVVVGLASLRRRRPDAPRLARTLGAAAIAGLVTVFVHSAFDFNLRIPSNALLGAALVSLLAASAEISPPAGQLPLLPRVLLGATLAGSLALGAGTAWVEARGAPAAMVARVGSAAGPELRRVEAEARVTADLRRRPASATRWIVLGWLRTGASDRSGSTLSAWGLGLSPQDEALRQATREGAGR